MADKFIHRTRKKFDNSQGAFIHTKERAKQRGKVDVQQSDYIKAVRAISTGQVELGKDLAAGRKEAEVKMRGEKLRVVYDVEAKLIVTVLPTELRNHHTVGATAVKKLDLHKKQRAERLKKVRKSELRKRAANRA